MNSGIDPIERTIRDINSLWSDARLALSKVDFKLYLEEHQTTISSANGNIITPDHPRGLNHSVREHFRQNHLDSLLSTTDQGQSFKLASKSPSSNSWLATGQYVSFAEYRFALKARCNLLPVKTVKARMTRNRPNPAQAPDTRCRKCLQQPETLAHVLNACQPSAGLMRERHNSILDRIHRAIPKSTVKTILVDQKIPHSPGQLRPDLVVISSPILGGTAGDSNSITVLYLVLLFLFEIKSLELFFRV